MQCWLENDTTPAESGPGACRRVGWSDGGEVGVDLDIWKMRSEPSDALSGDELTVVSRAGMELYTFTVSQPVIITVQSSGGCGSPPDGRGCGR